VTVAIAIFAFLATLGSLAALSRLHLLPTGYRPASNAVGDYGVGAYSGHYRALTAALAYAALLVAADIARTVQPVPQLLVYLLMTFAAARLAIPSFPADLDRGRPTPTGRIHLLLAGAAFGSIAWAAAIFRPRRLAAYTPSVVLGLDRRRRRRLRAAVTPPLNKRPSRTGAIERAPTQPCSSSSSR
jgi:hypothetical protein